MTMTRTLGRSGWTVSALGFGGMGDREPVAVRTGDVYGCGHSERVLGQALVGVRDQVVIATKFGLVFDEQRRTSGGVDVSPEYIRRACQASLRRLSGPS